VHRALLGERRVAEAVAWGDRHKKALAVAQGAERRLEKERAEKVQLAREVVSFHQQQIGGVGRGLREAVRVAEIRAREWGSQPHAARENVQAAIAKRDSLAAELKTHEEQLQVAQAALASAESAS
jgi:hypothetical protein